MSLWLDNDEVIELTGYRQRSKQYTELARQGREFTIRADGFPLVIRSQFETQATKRKREPDWSAITRN